MQGLLRRGQRGALLVEVRLGWPEVHVVIQMDHEGPGLDFVGGLWRPGRRCREPLWIALDGVFLFFCLGFLGNLPAYVDLWPLWHRHSARAARAL